MQLYNCKIALEKAVEVNEQSIKLAGKTEQPEKIIAQQELLLRKITEINDKVLHEAQSYKWSLFVIPSTHHYREQGIFTKN